MRIGNKVFHNFHIRNHYSSYKLYYHILGISLHNYYINVQNTGNNYHHNIGI